MLGWLFGRYKKGFALYEADRLSGFEYRIFYLPRGWGSSKKKAFLPKLGSRHPDNPEWVAVAVDWCFADGTFRQENYARYAPLGPWQMDNNMFRFRVPKEDK